MYCSIKQILLFNSLCVLTFLRNTNFSFRVFLYRSDSASDAHIALQSASSLIVSRVDYTAILPSLAFPRLLSYPGLTTPQFYPLWPSLVLIELVAKKVQNDAAALTDRKRKSHHIIPLLKINKNELTPF